MLNLTAYLFKRNNINIKYLGNEDLGKVFLV